MGPIIAGRPASPFVRSKTGETGREVQIARADARAAQLAPIVAELRRNGITSWYGIAMELNKRGVPTVSGRGIWDPKRLRRVMERPSAAAPDEFRPADQAAAPGAMGRHDTVTADWSATPAGFTIVESRFNNAEHWHSRAEEARVHAEQTHDANARALMLVIAESYERLAQRAAERNGQGQPA
jgi:hypothetical protein